MHDEITGIRGSWRQLWKSIENCQAHGLNVVFNSVALINNLSGIPKLKTFAEGKHISIRIDDKVLPLWDGIPRRNDMAISPKDRLWLYKELNIPFPEEECRETMTDPKDFQDQSCHVGFVRCYITPQGELWPCMDLRWPCGSLKDETFQEIWNHSKVLNMIRGIQKTHKPLEAPFCAYAHKERNFPGEKQKTFEEALMTCFKSFENCNAVTYNDNDCVPADFYNELAN